MASLDEAIRETKDVLQPIFSKPKLTTKLLTKPPFRFIHDVVTATLRSTGFPEGYFSPAELDSKNIKDKASKVAFLEKLVLLVGVCGGSAVNVRISKVVAGLEPSNTNVLLTRLGQAAMDAKLDRGRAVAHCLAGGGIDDFAKKGERESELRQSLVSDSVPISAAEKTGARSESKEVEPNKSTVSESKEEAPARQGPERGVNEAKEQEKAAAEPTEGKFVKDGVKSNPEEHLAAASQQPLLEERILQCNSEISQTRAMVSQIVSKPKCSDKLLGKPPFRFLHDLIMAINRETCFGLEQICREEEMVSSNVKDKRQKMAFLEKIISHVSGKLNFVVEARPGKIVAGLEPEKTCHFLQLLALAATIQSDPVPIDNPMSEISANHSIQQNVDAVGVKKIEQDIEYTPEAKVVEPSDDEAKKPDSREERAAVNTDDKREKEDAVFSVSKEHDLAEERPEQQEEQKASGEIKLTTASKDESPLPAKREQPQVRFDTSESPKADADIKAKASENDREGQKSRTHRPSAQRVSMEESELDMFANEARAKSISMRPTTARRRPPRIKDNNPLPAKTFEGDTVKPTVLMKDGDEDSELLRDERTESGAQLFAANVTPNRSDDGRTLNESADEHTAFVNKIVDEDVLESQDGKEAEAGKEEKAGIRLCLNLGKRKNEKNTAVKDVSPANTHAIIGLIQGLAQSTVPLGKCMASLPNDLQAMTRERDYWRSECQQNIEALEASKKRTDDALDPLRQKLSSLDEQVQEKIRQISSIRKKIKLDQKRLLSVASK